MGLVSTPALLQLAVAAKTPTAPIRHQHRDLQGLLS
jgi:hypothetical protein